MQFQGLKVGSNFIGSEREGQAQEKPKTCVPSHPPHLPPVCAQACSICVHMPISMLYFPIAK